MLRHGHDLQRLTDSLEGDSPEGESLHPSRLQVHTATLAVAMLAVVWFFVGYASLWAAISRGALSPAAIAVLGLLTSANLALLSLAAIASRSSRRGLRVFVVAVVLLNAVGSVVDQMGIPDVLYLLLSVATLVIVGYGWRRSSRISNMPT